MTPQSSISVMLTSARTSAIPHDSLLLAKARRWLLRSADRRSRKVSHPILRDHPLYAGNNSRPSALRPRHCARRNRRVVPSSSLHTSGERRNSLMLPRSQSLNASCNLPTPSGRTRSPRAHRGQRNCWHLGQRNELRFMKCSRTIGVPQRLHGSPSRP